MRIVLAEKCVFAGEIYPDKVRGGRTLSFRTNSRKTGNDWNFVIITATGATLADLFCRSTLFPPPLVPCCVRSRCRKHGLERPYVRVVCCNFAYDLTGSSFAIFRRTARKIVQQSAERSQYNLRFLYYVGSSIKQVTNGDFGQIIIWIVIERIRRKIFFVTRTEITICTCCVRNDYSSNITHSLHSSRNYNYMYAIWKKKQITLKYSFNEVAKREWVKMQIVRAFLRSFLLINNLCESRDAAFLLALIIKNRGKTTTVLSKLNVHKRTDKCFCVFFLNDLN